MVKTSVSTCANPECAAKFTRMGDGRLFVRPVTDAEGRPSQKVLWLCGVCAKQFDLRYDRRKQAFQIVHHRGAHDHFERVS